MLRALWFWGAADESMVLDTLLACMGWCQGGMVSVKADLFSFASADRV